MESLRHGSGRAMAQGDPLALDGGGRQAHLGGGFLRVPAGFWREALAEFAPSLKLGEKPSWPLTLALRHSRKFPAPL